MERFSIINSILVRGLGLVAIMVIGVAVARAQTANTPIPPEEQSEAFRDTMVRMQIQREETEHKKRIEKAIKIRDLAEDILKEAEGGKLPRSADQKLRDIEKSAKQIRSDSGGANDDSPLESPPQSLKQAAEQLDALSERFKANMEKTTRRIVSATVVAEASEIIQLVKIMRGYLN